VISIGEGVDEILAKVRPARCSEWSALFSSPGNVPGAELIGWLRRAHERADKVPGGELVPLDPRKNGGRRAGS
jgi:hypothetical protein